MFFPSDLLKRIPGIEHGFGTAGEPVPTPFAQDWESMRPRWKQVHGTRLAAVRCSADDVGETDALWTRALGVLIAVQTADCVPILMARQDGGAVAAIHAGWRGTFDRIVQEAWRELRGQGENPGDWVAAIGPSIRACCYEVSPELSDQFMHEFPELEPAKILPRPRMLDLVYVNRMELSRAGVREIDVLPGCTFCAKREGQHLFRSYRREGTGVRQFSVIRRI